MFSNVVLLLIGATGIYCTIPSNTSVFHLVQSDAFELFTVPDIRDELEPQRFMQFYTITQVFQSDDGGPIDVLLLRLSPYHRRCYLYTNVVEIDGVKGYTYEQVFEMHRGESGRVTIEVVVDNFPERYTMYAVARKVNRVCEEDTERSPGDPDYPWTNDDPTDGAPEDPLNPPLEDPVPETPSMGNGPSEDHSEEHDAPVEPPLDDAPPVMP
uniref:Secreted protein n=1 Tax=Steinernema glaseri TaxID=37863 RepID=A0A1I8A526_9BILA